jgi:hypothetical protein
MANDSYASMSDEPNPLNDVRRGLGLLLRAARTAARKLPTTDLEDVVTTSAREVGRAIENVAVKIEREVFGRGGSPKPPPSGSGGPEGASKRPGEAASKGDDADKDPHA